MIRQKYIRFFISSTFADMDMERNILHNIIERMRQKYAATGWTITDVDLRWGISEDMQQRNSATARWKYVWKK